MGKIIISRTFGRYKMRVKLTSIARLRKCDKPPPMVGDPPWKSWEDRCEKLYAANMAEKAEWHAKQAARYPDTREYLTFINELAG